MQQKNDGKDDVIVTTKKHEQVSRMKARMFKILILIRIISVCIVMSVQLIEFLAITKSNLLLFMPTTQKRPLKSVVAIFSSSHYFLHKFIRRSVDDKRSGE